LPYKELSVRLDVVLQHALVELEQQRSLLFVQSSDLGSLFRSDYRQVEVCGPVKRAQSDRGDEDAQRPGADEFEGLLRDDAIPAAGR